LKNIDKAFLSVHPFLGKYASNNIGMGGAL
jgi:hypothetical protein